MTRPKPARVHDCNVFPCSRVTKTNYYPNSMLAPLNVNVNVHVSAVKVRKRLPSPLFSVIHKCLAITVVDPIATSNPDRGTRCHSKLPLPLLPLSLLQSQTQCVQPTGCGHHRKKAAAYGRSGRGDTDSLLQDGQPVRERPFRQLYLNCNRCAW